MLRPQVQSGQRETSSDLQREDLRVGQCLIPLPDEKAPPHSEPLIPLIIMLALPKLQPLSQI